MLIVDILLLAIAAISVVFAIYRGFLASLLGVAACAVSLFVALTFGPRLSEALSRNQGVTDLLSTYTDAKLLVGDVSLGATPVDYLAADTMESILKTVPLPDALTAALRQNIQNKAFADREIYSINGYISATIVSVILNSASFLACFFLCFLALHILINLIDHVFYFPVLRHMDGLAAAVMGLIRGALVLYVLAIVFPLARAAIPFEEVQLQIDASRFLPILYSEKLLLRVIAGG